MLPSFYFAVVAAVVAAVLAGSAATAMAQQTISADAFSDKARGMWLGQIVGNYAGRLYEGADASGGLTVTINWGSVLATPSWSGDDDTCFEYLYATHLAATATLTSSDATQIWRDHIPLPGFYVANRQARFQIAKGVGAPDSGSRYRNFYWDMIDSQITTESLGAAAPGMRQRAADLTAVLGGVTNDGYALHAAQFYAAMYAQAAVSSDIEDVVEEGLEVVPADSLTYQIVRDVQALYQADKLAGTLSGTDTWRAAQASIYYQYCSVATTAGHFRGWTGSAINTAMTTLAVLYGQGDLKRTAEIGVLAGFDCDCNPATAAGLVGMIRGYSNLPADVRAAADGYVVPAVPEFTTLTGGIQRSTTISDVAMLWQQAAERQILAGGGSIVGTGAGRQYMLPADAVVRPPSLPQPAGPRGLVGSIIAAGGSVSVTASVTFSGAVSDRKNLLQIIDGKTDPSREGWSPYWSNDWVMPQPAGGDYYQINLPRRVAFSKVVYYEGDIYASSSNDDPATTEPIGGYFTDLRVEVRQGGVFRPVSGLTFSEPLDPFKFYQTIELSFAPTLGDAVRIIGSAGGQWQFTSICELEAYGSDAMVLSQMHFVPADIDAATAGGVDLTGDGAGDAADLGFLVHAVIGTEYGDTNLDGQVAIGDLVALAQHWGKQGGWADGDFDGDGLVRIGDLVALAQHWQYGTAASAVPEPASLAAMLAGAGLMALVGRQPTRRWLCLRP
jgi:hypothetical protein